VSSFVWVAQGRRLFLTAWQIAMWQRVLVTMFALLAVCPAIAEDCRASAVGYKVMHLGDRVVAVWYPTTGQATQYAYTSRFSGMVAPNGPASMACGKPVPLVIFSHGDLGCGLQSIAFTEDLARHGYVVAAPDHADAFLCHIVHPRLAPSHPPAQPDFFKPDTWSDATFADRRDDIEATIDGLLSDDDFQRIIDARNIGVSGHSLGGYTAVGMVGGWSSWIDLRIRAVLALSPYVMPFQTHKTLPDIRVPLMYQGGTVDIGITPFLKGANGAYRQANPPVFFVELRNAGHFAWTNCGNALTTAACLTTKVNARLINEYGIAFFDSYLKNKTEPILTEDNPELSNYLFRLPNK
jgi:predicted dienelactone hydrolase